MRQLLESCPREELYVTYGGSEELLAELRRKLEEWLKLQPHLPQDIPKYLLEHFIIHTKFSLEIAKQKLEMYYTVRRYFPELFIDRDVEKMKRFQETTQWVPLPKLTPANHRVTIYRNIDKDTDKFNFYDDLKWSYMIADVRIAECNSVGDIYIFDLANMSLGHLVKLSPAALKKSEIITRRAFAASIKGVHLVNVPPFINRVINLVKATITSKIAGRVHVHSSNYESLHEFIPKSVLPVEYGGDEISMKELTNLWNKKLLEWKGWFTDQEKIMVDESLRPGPMMNSDELFGFCGSFRKLEFD